MPNLTGRVVKSDWQLSTLKNSPYIPNAIASILNMEACLCVAYFVSQSGYSKSFEQPCINTSVKRLCMSERCNEKVTCFLMSHASYKQPHKPVSHGVLNAYNLILV